MLLQCLAKLRTAPLQPPLSPSFSQPQPAAAYLMPQFRNAAPFCHTMSRLQALRAVLAKNNVKYYIVLTQDAHDSEYVAAADDRRSFLTGFTGSAGTAIVGPDSAELSTDGRYFLQASQQLSSEWTLRKAGTPGTKDWTEAIVERANTEGATIGVDPRLISSTMAELMQSKLKEGSLVAIEENLVDAIWTDKPAEPSGEVISLGNTGETSKSKLERVRKELQDKGVAGIVLSALDDVAWLFNLRGSDIDYNPVFKSYAIVTPSSATLYVDLSKVSKVSVPGVNFAPYDQVWEDIKSFDGKLWIPEGSSWAVATAASSIASKAPSPVKLFKAKKNNVEIDGAKEAQLKCGISVVRLLAWLERTIDSEQISEYAAAEKLLAFRQELDEFRGNSFPTISSVGANAAIIHYSPSPEGKSFVNRKEVYLLDTGCQFTHGTTDTTRTVHFGTPTDAEREAYTLVLKGHIGLAMMVFPEGTNGTQLDSFARQFLWQYGLDYRHGTGHGVGAYLNVHEPPVGFGTAAWAKAPLEPGNLISNEPGYYEDNSFGIRIENLVVVNEKKTKYNFGGKKYLGLETITLVPLALNMIDVSLLTTPEKDWINSYSAQVRNALEPHLESEDIKWLRACTESI